MFFNPAKCESIESTFSSLLGTRNDLLGAHSCDRHYSNILRVGIDGKADSVLFRGHAVWQIRLVAKCPVQSEWSHLDNTCVTIEVSATWDGFTS